jgi:hypothetical protein
VGQKYPHDQHQNGADGAGTDLTCLRRIRSGTARVLDKVIRIDGGHRPNKNHFGPAGLRLFGDVCPKVTGLNNVTGKLRKEI